MGWVAAMQGQGTAWVPSAHRCGTDSDGSPPFSVLLHSPGFCILNSIKMAPGNFGRSLVFAFIPHQHLELFITVLGTMCWLRLAQCGSIYKGSSSLQKW